MKTVKTNLMFEHIKDILRTIVIMMFMYLLFLPIVWLDNRWTDYRKWYYTRRGIPFKTVHDKFGDVVTRLD